MGGIVEQQDYLPPQSVTDRVWDLFTDDVLTVIGLGLGGVLIGIATVQAVKLGLRVFKGEPEDLPTKATRALLYRFVGMVLGGVYAAALVTVLTDYALGVRLIVGTGVGIIAGGFTPRGYDLWHNNVWPWISSKVNGKKPPDDDGGGPDQTMTNFKP